MKDNNRSGELSPAIALQYQLRLADAGLLIKREPTYDAVAQIQDGRASWPCVTLLLSGASEAKWYAIILE